MAKLPQTALTGIQAIYLHLMQFTSPVMVVGFWMALIQVIVTVEISLFLIFQPVTQVKTNLYYWKTLLGPAAQMWLYIHILCIHVQVIYWTNISALAWAPNQYNKHKKTWTQLEQNSPNLGRPIGQIWVKISICSCTWHDLWGRVCQTNWWLPFQTFIFMKSWLRYK